MIRFLLILLLIPVLSHSQNKEILQSHSIKLTNAKAYTLQVASAMPADEYHYKPVPEEMSFKEQLIHLGENLFWLSSKYIREEENPYLLSSDKKAGMSKEAVIQFVSEAYDYAIKAIKALDNTTLNKQFPWGKGLMMNKYQFLNLIQDHQTHHRAQLIVYLRLKGITPPRYTGW